MPSRREYLAVLGAAVTGVAGCLSRDDGDAGGGAGTPTNGRTGTATPTPTPTGTEPPTTNGTTAGVGDDIVVSNVAVYDAVTYYAWPGSTQVLAPSDEQFVVATVDGPEDEPAPEFVFAADGETWPRAGIGTQSIPDSELAGRGGGPVGGDNDASGYLAFQVPSPLSASEPRIRRSEDATWPLPEAARERLSTPSPSFALESLDVPENVVDTDEFTVDLTVENTSDVDGRFLAAVTWPTGYADDDESHVLEDDVAAGASASFSLALNPAAPAPGDEGTVTLSVHGYVAAERTVRVAE